MKINYTQEHSSYKVPTKEEIIILMEYCGYTGYFPDHIFYELVNLITWHATTGYYRLGFSCFRKGPKEQYDKFIEFYDSIQWEFYCSYKLAPAATALVILRDLSETVNLRKLNSQEIDFVEDCDNLEFIISEEEQEYFDKIDSKKSYEIDVQRVLKFSALLNTVLPVKKEGDNVTRIQTHLKRVKDVLKARKSSFVRPTFKIDVLMKKLPITEIKPESEEQEIVVFMEDASSSMMNNNGYLLGRAVQKLLLEDPRIVHYYRFVGQSIQFFELNTTAEKLECFTMDHPYYKSNCDYRHLFKNVLPIYNGGNIIIVTDSQDNIPRKVDTSMKIFCLDASARTSIDMKRLCKLTNGKYLQL